MPISKYNEYFGGEKGSAEKAKRAMEKQYGKDKGEQVFYAKINKMRSEGGMKELAREHRRKK